ncbi:unnamed protein product [Clonostachys byssicola]|uniref:Uncharacterized protein n=1 Tax=Clonostachys byssicola TaxID=160290 RepID=A0A9N9U164_9HYPO|nr:unnamed protein product [Clonostachys byssicola]
MCNLNSFNGKSEDMLNSTSLHLSFTDWSRPLGPTTTISGKDVDGLVMESVVSIREHGRWVGDIDPANALQNPIVILMGPQEPCSHPPDEPPAVPMTAVECWDELRDCPEKLVVVKAHGNWVARLAATAYLVECSKQTPTKVKRITICPQKGIRFGRVVLVLVSIFANTGSNERLPSLGPGRVYLVNALSQDPQAAYDGTNLAHANEGNHKEDKRTATSTIHVLDLRARQMWEDNVPNHAKHSGDNDGPVDPTSPARQVPKRRCAKEGDELRNAGQD